MDGDLDFLSNLQEDVTDCLFEVENALVEHETAELQLREEQSILTEERLFDAADELFFHINKLKGIIWLSGFSILQEVCLYVEGISILLH